MSERGSKKEMIDMMLATGEIDESEYRRLWQTIESEDDKGYQASMRAQVKVEDESGGKSGLGTMTILLCLATSCGQLFIAIAFVVMNRMLLSKFVDALEQLNANLSLVEQFCVNIYGATLNNTAVAILTPGLLLPGVLGIVAILTGKVHFIGLMTLITTLFSGLLVAVFVAQFFVLYYAVALAM